MPEDTKHKTLKAVLFYLAPLLMLASLVALLYTTDPLASGPLSILIVFIFIYLLIFTTLCVLFRLIAIITRVINPLLRLPMRRAYYFLSVFSMAPVLLVALNTLGQLNLLECVLIFVFVGLGCFYVLRRTA